MGRKSLKISPVKDLGMSGEPSGRTTTNTRHYKYSRLRDHEDLLDDDVAEPGCPQHMHRDMVQTLYTHDHTTDELCNHNGGEVFELRSRSGNALQEKPVEEEEEEPYVEVAVKNGDTLQSIALKYRCPMAELRRINRFIRDQDFHARNFIKVPARKHGILAEMVKEQLAENGLPSHSQHPGGASVLDMEVKPCSSVSDYCETEESESGELVRVRTLSIGRTMKEQSKQAEAFLKHMDKDIKKIIESTNSHKDTLEEVTASLTEKRILPLKKKPRGFWAADCGIQRWTVLAVMFLVAFVVPLLVVLYRYFYRTDHSSANNTEFDKGR